MPRLYGKVYKNEVLDNPLVLAYSGRCTEKRPASVPHSCRPYSSDTGYSMTLAAGEYTIFIWIGTLYTELHWNAVNLEEDLPSEGLQHDIHYDRMCTICETKLEDVRPCGRCDNVCCMDCNPEKTICTECLEK